MITIAWEVGKKIIVESWTDDFQQPVSKLEAV